MKFFDLLSIIFENLGRRKGRVALTAVGVIIGTAAIIILVSLAIGLQRNATASFASMGDLTQIQVWPAYSEEYTPMGPSMVAPITDKSLADFAALPNVQAVVIKDYLYGQAIISYNRLEGYPNVMGFGTSDLSLLGLTAEQGVTALERGTAVIGNQVAMNFYNPYLRPGQAPPEPPDLMGARLKLTLIKYDQNGQEIRKSVQIRVTGILTTSGSESDWTMHLSMEDVNSWNAWFTGRRINRNKDGYQNVVVKVSDVSQTVDVANQIIDMGYQAYTLLQVVEGINSYYLILQVAFGGVGAIALFVAALGIANTMTMAILERTREIGLMKAVGANNRVVLNIFLGEAAGIGLIGGLGGVLVGWIGGQVINVLGLIYLSSQMSSGGGMGMPTLPSVYTPAWLVIFALVFAILMGLGSGIFPALRAATMIPVSALKYE